MIDKKTGYLGLPLPNEGNLLEEDLPRIAASLGLIDANAKDAAARLDQAVAGLGQSMAGGFSEAETRLLAEVAAREAALARLEAELLARLAAMDKRLSDPWGLFPLFTPVGVPGLRFESIRLDLPDLDDQGNQKTDAEGNLLTVEEWVISRHPIMPGEKTPRENWLICDGGDNGLGGFVPDLRGRFILGADAAHAAESTGGSAKISGTISGTAAGNTNSHTLSIEQTPGHNHGFYATVNKFSAMIGNLGWCEYGGQPQNAGTDWRGSGQGHGHYASLGVSGQCEAENLPPHLALNFIVRVK